MKAVIVAWCNTTTDAFENHVPLRFVGYRNRMLGLSNEIHVLILDGFSRLSTSYRAELASLGYILHDVGSLFSMAANRYNALNRFGDYEKKCFLRWPIIEQFFAGDPIVHFDGDIVFNEDPAVITSLVKGTTFVMQGCPAFTVVSDADWFSQYRQQLDDFTRDIEAYSRRAWVEREDWQVTFRTRWAGSRFREIITSDQDLLSHLIHTRGIMQTSVEQIMLRLQDYLCFENPLFIHLYDDNFPYRYSREQGIDYVTAMRIDGKPVPIRKKILFWHMQSCFNFYLSKFLLRRTFFGSIPLGRIPLTIGTPSFEDTINKYAQRFLGHTSRLNVYRYFFEKKDFSGIFKANIWWKKGIFE